ncbi:Phosphatidylinositol-4-phosphate 5-kinase [Apophysomyces sp. BC1021]|nr:Phosphatidylinositol-4-phosphate 5-kinase [Apophysomyces sp. BC1021]
MGNVFPANKDVHEVYDLKGSTFGRLVAEDELTKNPNSVMKDQNWINRNKKLQLGPDKREILLLQLQRDVESPAMDTIQGKKPDAVRKALRCTNVVQLDTSELPESPSEE